MNKPRKLATYEVRSTTGDEGALVTALSPSLAVASFLQTVRKGSWEIQSSHIDEHAAEVALRNVDTGERNILSARRVTLDRKPT